MQDKGLTQKAVVEELESKLSKDFTYSSGKIIGSMCTDPHPFAKKVYRHLLNKNLGDPGLFPGVAALEKEAIHMMGNLFSCREASGHIVTGGTEANILALWTAKKSAKKSPCEVIVPCSGHHSLDKAADLLGLKIVKIGLNKKHQVDVDAVKDAINGQTIAIVGIAGTTSLGAVDPMPQLSEIAEDNNLFLHVDAAFGGFVLPFIKSTSPEFDFAVPGVCSLTVDPHKMGWAAIPAGGILFRNESLGKLVNFNVSYLAGGETEQMTLVGTRSGASAVSVWALLKHLGREGYRRMVDRCMRLTRFLSAEIPKVDGLGIVMEPAINIVGLKSRTFDIRLIARKLRARRWAVALFPSHIRLVVMPHIQEHHIKQFLKDLEDIVES